ncbi:MAG TPA: TonB-dependent receptor, partial [Burkholderiaceae bacterium]
RMSYRASSERQPRPVPSRPWHDPLAFAVIACLASASAFADDDTSRNPNLRELEGVLAQPVYGDGRSASASKHSQDLETAPAAVIVRTGGEIRAQGYRTLAEVLASMPGIHLQYDRVYTYGGIRGLNRPGDFTSRLLVLIDGVRINDPLYEGGPLGREFPLDVGLIDRVEFVAGPGSALYGSSAVLGVVNVITRTPSQLPGLNAVGEIGSGWNRKLGATWGGELAGGRLLLGAATERRPGGDLYFAEFDTPETNHGIAHKADGELASKLFLKARWTGFTITGGLSNREKYLPTASYDTVFNTPNLWIDRFGYLNAETSRRLDQNQEVQARLGFERYQFRSRNLLGPANDPSLSTEADNADAYSGEARYTWLGWAGHRLTAGIEFQRNTRQAIQLGTVTPVPQTLTDFKVSSNRHAVFASDEWQALPSLLLNVGARADWRIDGERTTSPRWAAIWTPAPRWTVKWTQGSAFREPNAYERLYGDDTQKGNPRLKVETLRSRELLALWRPAESLTLEASFYSFRIRDLVELMTDDDGVNVFRNRGELESRGADLTATYVWPHGTQLRVSLSRQRAIDRETGATLSGAPRTLAKFAWTVPAALPGATFGLNGQYVSSRLTRSDARLDGYFRANAQLSYAPAGQPWSIAFGVYNLTGERHWDPAGPELVQDAIQQDGREFRLQLGWTF